MNHARRENKTVLSRERKLSRNLRIAPPLVKSLAIFGFTSWSELESGIKIVGILQTRVLNFWYFGVTLN